MLCISAAYAVMRCPSVRPSITFVHYVKTNKDIFEISSPSSSHTILVFPHQTSLQYSDGNPPPLTGASNAGRVKRNCDSETISGFIAYAVNAATASCYQHDRRPIPGYRSIPAGASAIKWRSSVQWCITVTVQVCLRHRKSRSSEYAEEKRT